MSLLEQIQTGKAPGPRRAMIYGVHGVGKSTFAANAPAPIFVQTEDGLGEIGCDRFQLSVEFRHVIAALNELHSGDHGYQTVVIDSLDWLERLIWADVCRARSIANIEDIGYGKGYMFAVAHWRQVLGWLGAIRRDRNMHVVLLAHAHIERFNDPEAEPYDRYTPRLHRLASAVVQEWCDEVLFASYRVFTTTTDEGFNRKRTKGVGSGERIIRTTERPSHLAKNRLNLPDEMPLDWAEYAQHFTTTDQETTNG